MRSLGLEIFVYKLYRVFWCISVVNKHEQSKEMDFIGRYSRKGTNFKPGLTLEC